MTGRKLTKILESFRDESKNLKNKKNPLVKKLIG